MSDLGEIKGVGNTAKSKLKEVGIESVSDLANADQETLEESGVRAVEKIQQRAQKAAVIIESGESVAEEQSKTDKVPTGIEEWDELTEGGLDEGFLIGLAGEPDAGKTQFVFQSLVSAVEATGKPAVYIETEPNRYQAERINQISTKDDTGKLIHRVQAYSLDQQIRAYEAVQDHFDELSLVVVDSFVANFRLSDEFEGRADFKKRSDTIARHLRTLQHLANTNKTPVLITLQVYGNPSAYDSSIPIWGGSLMHHTITSLIFLSHSKGQLREATLKSHPSLGEIESVFKITDNGVESV
jgi:RecA/RadA recombinase